MGNSPKHAGRRLGSLLAAGIVAATTIVSAPLAGAAPEDLGDVARIDATGAVDAGITISQLMYPAGTADAAIIARADNFPDGLAASALASAYDAPILFTATAELDDATRVELQRALGTGNTKKVFIAGGPAAISDAVKTEIESLGYDVDRFSGASRDNTAALIALRMLADTKADGSKFIVARAFGGVGDEQSSGWVDAISCGAYAAAKRIPVLLTNDRRDNLSAATASLLKNYPDSEVIICGGRAAVPESHATEASTLVAKVSRYFGADRAATAVDVAERLWGHPTRDNHSYVLVPGYNGEFWYGLAAAPFAGDNDSPILMVGDDRPTDCDGDLDERAEATLCYLETGTDPISFLYAVGSKAAISDDVFETAGTSGGLVADVTPPPVPTGLALADVDQDDGTQLDVAFDAVADDRGGDVTYTILFAIDGDDPFDPATAQKRTTNATSFRLSGLTAGEAYEVAVRAEDKAGNRSDPSDVAASNALVDEVPAAPAGAPGAQNVGDGLQITWIPAPEADAASYSVERGQAVNVFTGGTSCTNQTLPIPASVSWAEIASPAVGTESFLDTGVTEGTSYCYRYSVNDTTSPPNNSGTSPVVGPIERVATNDDLEAPQGLPTILSVSYDEKRGLVPAGSGTTRSSSSEMVIDVAVPADAFGSGDIGRIEVREDGETVDSQAFTATGDDQIVTFTMDLGGDGDYAPSVRMADTAGNFSGESTPWEVSVNAGNELQPGYAPSPRITRVDGVNVDPLAFPNAVGPDAGSADDPRVDTTPAIRVEGLDSSRGYYLDLYAQSTRLLRTGCLSGDDIKDGIYTFNDPSRDADFELDFSSQTTFEVVAAPGAQGFGNCGSRSEALRSGDSNSVRYALDTTGFGIEAQRPAAAASDPFAFRDGDAGSPATVNVIFNRAATATSRLTVTGPGGYTRNALNDEATAAGNRVEDAAADNAREIRMVLTDLAPGRYTLTVAATSADAPVATFNQTTSFTAGIVGVVHATASEAVDPTQAASGDAGALETFVVDAAAPSGSYGVGTADTVCSSATHTTGTESRFTITRSTTSACGSMGTTTSFTEGSATPTPIHWTYTSGNRTSLAQNDGLIPAILSTDDRAAVGFRQSSGDAFILDGADSLSTRSYGYEVLAASTQRPNSGNRTYTSPPALARRSNSALVALPNENVTTTSGANPATAYVVRDVASGNVSAIALDGVVRKLSEITPQPTLEGLTKLNPGDRLRLTFSGTLELSSPTPAADGGIQIREGSDRDINPVFGASAGNGTVALATPAGSSTASAIDITFGSASTIDGTAIGSGSDVTGPTSVHSGSSVFLGLNWLVSSATDGGHAVLLPPTDQAVSNPNSF